ncbi:aldo/keto reductase [Streptacidiphilus sp. P02-A3a]|uniref:aldo/keto reductase n=1 Tax=Streptacidiphilus sp. P02-A3a TaxID=2704468 RepID=UPI0015F93989|nr:aldo/keto reductase [Streptacidiphilus sp. P02-A3a]QMU67597.1 aldo/keto reductase [Streptacidiphilus sp. P02-A3a]
MRYRNLGRRQVSSLCLGTLPFGTLVDEQTSFALLDRFTERGGTFVDTANCYCFWIDGCDGGESESLLGRWLAARGNRDEVVLATKLGALPAPGDGEWPTNREGLSAPVIAASIHPSLRRLGTDRVDLLYGHVDDPATPLAETVAAFGALVREGLAEQVGISNQPGPRVVRSRELAAELGVPRYTALQQRHTYLRPGPGTDFDYQIAVDDPQLAYARTQPDLTVLAYGPLLNGAYTDPAKPLPEQYDHPAAHAQLSVLSEIARELDATRNQVVLAWMLGSEPSVLPIIGVSRLTQLDEALDAVELRLTPEQHARLDAARG